MQATNTFYGWEVRTRFENRRTITTITLRGHEADEPVAKVVTRGDRHKVQHERLVRFAEYAEARPQGFDVDPLVLHNIAVGRGAF